MMKMKMKKEERRYEKKMMMKMKMKKEERR